MKVYYDREGKFFTVKATNVRDMLKELHILRNAVIIAVNGEIVTDDYALKEKDKVKILSVVSGG